ncbi:Fic family protein [Nocardia sp. NPDC058497]|uniref:Fic family protein n=1 Tax=Nocardia sp. NPDC058497 TaxID=3346529 RepID=UPI0036509380
MAELRRYGGMPLPAEAAAIWDDIWHTEAHNSTAIEGNTLVLREVEALLEHGKAVGAKPLSDYLEVLGYGEAAQWVYAQASSIDGYGGDELITVTEVRGVHEQAMRHVWEVSPHPQARPAEGPGGFREHDIHPIAQGTKPPPWVEVPGRVRSWVDAVNAFGAALCIIGPGSVAAQDIPVRLAEIHCEFERIHPFLDGNGRTGRLVLNLVLVRLGFPPAIIFKRDRAKYLQALQRADRGDYGLLAELIARSVIDNLHRFVVPGIAGPRRLVPLQSLADDDVSYNALRQAALRGRLDAHQGSDGMWRSTKAAVEAYLANRYRRNGSSERSG